MMSIPNPLSILQSILSLLDYGNRIARAREEIKGYLKTISRASSLVLKIRGNLLALNRHLNDREKQEFCEDICEVETELAEAQKLVQGVEKRGGRWPISVTWVFKTKAIAQTYESAVLQCIWTLSRIDTQLFIVKESRALYKSPFLSQSFMQSYSAADNLSLENLPLQLGVDRRQTAPPLYYSLRPSTPEMDYSLRTKADLSDRAANRRLHAWLRKKARQNYLL